jgi:hypothetical protein
MTLRASSFGSKCEMPEDFIKKSKWMMIKYY